ncbi:MAG: hypothetical protein MJ086_00300 [Lachnospiraceae bacterium]|nr:hypothetical protein [Lachnospiraceae bacterium]
MKKLAVLLAAALLVVGCLTACGGTQPEQPEQGGSSVVEPIRSGVVEPGMVAGGWTVNSDETKAFLPEGFEEVFNKALEGYAGMGLEPVAYLGSQVVAGRNHMVLCKGTTVAAEPITELKVAVIYQDLEDNAEITKVTDFNLGAIAEMDSSKTEAGLAGGWNVTDTFGAPNMPVEVQEPFDKAMEGLTGVNYQPMAFLGSQVVAGANYAVLCHGTTVTAEPTNNIYVVYVYAGLDGTASVNNIVCLNLTDFS